MSFELHTGNCLDILATMPDNSVDAIVTDPPYGLAFMGKKWDYDVPSEDIWRECLRVLKPGGHLLAFAGTRTQHRMAVRIEDAGFEIRDMIAWVYGSGFPKSHDISKAIDKAAGAKREVVGYNATCGLAKNKNLNDDGWSKIGSHGANITAPATNSAKQWQGWGTSLKPALEPITVARKPFTGTVAANVLQWGTGGVNVDGCRVGTEVITQRLAQVVNGSGIGAKAVGIVQKATGETTTTFGRFPANLIHDGSDEAVFGMGESARYFYCAKASKRDRDEGCEGMPQTVQQSVAHGDKKYGTLPYTNEPREINPRPRTNHHPTVKPTDLMRYLCRLVTPPDGIVLDPFMGSGSTGKAAILEGFQFIGIDMTPEYVDIARARIEHAFKNKQNTLDL
jgi:site-specific DNA-methyltransferase (adenine-specific)